MALDNKVLDNFFNKTKKPVDFSRKLKDERFAANTVNTEIGQIPRRFRVFDDPTNENNSREDVTKENLGQSSDKVRIKHKTNLGQSSDKVRTISDYQEKTSDKLKTELRTEPRTNLGQKQAAQSSHNTFSSLVGLQRKVTLFIYESCKLCGDKITRSISIEHLAKQCETTVLSAQKTIQRLEKKMVIYRADYKNGRSGWTKYGLPEAIFQELLHNDTYEKLTLKLGQTSDKLKTELRTELRTNPSSSSSYIINNKTTTSQSSGESTDDLLLSQEWETLDLEPLAEIGFSKHHLLQIARQNKIAPMIVQDSIHAFAFDLKENNKGKSLKTSPLNYFMGILRNGNPYAAPSNYESPESRAMRIYLEKKREVDQKRIAIEEELFDVEFTQWKDTLTNEQIDKLLPEEIKNSRLTAPKTAYFRSHFRNEIWLVKLEQIKNVNY